MHSPSRNSRIRTPWVSGQPWAVFQLECRGTCVDMNPMRASPQHAQIGSRSSPPRCNSVQFSRSPILLRFPRLRIISTRDVFGKNNHGRPGAMEMILKSPNRTARPRVPHDREQQRCPMSGCGILMKLTPAHETPGDVRRLQFGPFGRRMGGEDSGQRR